MNLNKDIRGVISNIKAQIQEINAKEREQYSPPKILTLENLLLGESQRTREHPNNKDPGKKGIDKKGVEVMEHNALLYRAQKMNYRKSRTPNPIALEMRARAFHGIEPGNGRLMNQDMEALKARSNASNYYQVTESDNLLNDLTLEIFQKPWGKLDAAIKINRVIKFAESLQLRHKLSENEFRELRILLISLVNKKQISKKTDVRYNEEEGELQAIPGLNWNEDARKFNYSTTMRNTKKKASQAQQPVPVIIQRKVQLTGISDLTEEQQNMLSSKLGSLAPVKI